MKLNQSAIATPTESELSKLVYYLCQRLLISESRINDLESLLQQVIKTQKEQQINMKEMEELVNLIMFDYRYSKDRNADLEATLSFYYPED